MSLVLVTNGAYALYANLAQRARVVQLTRADVAV
jgi:hypothetical protein